MGGAVATAAVYFGLFAGSGKGPSGTTTANGDATESAVEIGEKSPLSALNQALRDSDPAALAVVQNRLAPRPDAPAPAALTEADAAEWLETLSCLRTGLTKFGPPARATVAVVVSRIFDRFAIDPAPALWIKALPTAHDILAACLTDPDSNVRFITLGEVSHLWVWMPGRSLIEVEEDALGTWKESLHRPVVRCLASPDVRTRIAAVACLGFLPIDAAAAPALPYLEDSSVDVRRQAVVSFAQRPRLLTEDMLLKRLHDEDPNIRETVDVVLKARGLTHEQIELGSLMVSPKPQQRASVVKLIQNRTDIDPEVWLLQLSHDADETVRIQAAEALASQKNQSITAKRRLAEMARSDSSQEVRKTAAKHVPSTEETTAALPPLPGSSILNPKAN
jgi:HEAT repeat protein